GGFTFALAGAEASLPRLRLYSTSCWGEKLLMRARVADSASVALVLFGEKGWLTEIVEPLVERVELALGDKFRDEYGDSNTPLPPPVAAEVGSEFIDEEDVEVERKGRLGADNGETRTVLTEFCAVAWAVADVSPAATVFALTVVTDETAA